MTAVERVDPRQARLREIADEMTSLADHDQMTRSQERRWLTLNEESRALTTELDREHLERLLDSGDFTVADGVTRTDPTRRDVEPASALIRSGDPWTPADAPVLDRARRALDTLSRARDGLATDQAACEKVTRALDGHDGADVGELAAWTAVTSDPLYRSAFVKLLHDPQFGHREFSDRELAAFQRARQLQRAMSLTDSAGGFLVPFQLDPSIILTSAGSANPIRRLARIVTATGDVWHGVSSSGIVASWAGEEAEATDDSPTLDQPSIPVHKLHAFVPISIEAFQDEATVATEVARLLADATDQLQAEAFVTGTGTNQPTGIVTALAGTASQISAATADTVADSDVLATQNQLPARFRMRDPAWTANLSFINDVLRTFEHTTGGAAPFVNEDGTRMLGWPLNEASFMDPFTSPATGADNDHVLVAGAWDNYVVADRVGTTVELIPHLFGANSRPTGQRGWYMFARVGADSVNDNAFRMLSA